MVWAAIKSKTSIVRWGFLILFHRGKRCFPLMACPRRRLRPRACRRWRLGTVTPFLRGRKPVLRERGRVPLSLIYPIPPAVGPLRDTIMETGPKGFEQEPQRFVNWSSYGAERRRRILRQSLSTLDVTNCDFKFSVLGSWPNMVYG